MPLVCDPGEIVCRENYLSQCSPSGTTWVELEECENGCFNARCLEAGEFPFSFDLTGFMAGNLPAVSGGIAGIIVVAIIVLYVFKIRKK
jgi:hypothetical protein